MRPVDWNDVRVLVTGGRGFLGTHLVRLLTQRGARVTAAGRTEADLRDRAAAERLVQEARPEVVVHAAVEGGGIGWMRDHPVESGRDNALVNLHILDAAWRGGVRLFIGVSSACAYPRTCPVPFRERDIHAGPPEPTNGPYAGSKRLMMELGRAYHQQHGLVAVFPVLANLYGPGDALTSERAHVVADLVLRCLSRPQELVVWGTGRATRELIYVEDAADGVLACAALDSPDPINIGTGQELSVEDLARAVALACGFDGALRFDPSRPDGQPRKCLDVSAARLRLGWQAQTPLDEGLRRTVDWYRSALSAEAPR